MSKTTPPHSSHPGTSPSDEEATLWIRARGSDKEKWTNAARNHGGLTAWATKRLNEAAEKENAAREAAKAKGKK